MGWVVDIWIQLLAFDGTEGKIFLGLDLSWGHRIGGRMGEKDL